MRTINRKMADKLQMSGCPQCGGILDYKDGVYSCPACKWTAQIEPEKVGILKRVWVWLDYKKTIIGAVGSLIGTGLTKVPHAITQAVGYMLMALCYPLTVIGVVHKIGKASKYGPPGEFHIDDLIAAVKDLISAIGRIYKILSQLFKKKGA